MTSPQCQIFKQQCKSTPRNLQIHEVLPLNWRRRSHKKSSSFGLSQLWVCCSTTGQLLERLRTKYLGKNFSVRCSSYRIRAITLDSCEEKMEGRAGINLCMRSSLLANYFYNIHLLWVLYHKMYKHIGRHRFLSDSDGLRHSNLT